MPTNSNYGPSYQDYLEQGRLHYSSRVDEGSDMEFAPQYTEAEWNALSSLDRYGAFLPNSVGRDFYRLSDGDPLVQQFYQQFGRSNAVDNSGFELGNQRQTGLAIGYNNDRNGVAGPQYGRLDWNQLAIDPTRLMWLDPEGTQNRRYVYEAGNQRGDAVAAEQARDDDSGLGDAFPYVGVGAVLGGGLLANSLLGSGVNGAGLLSESIAPQVTETMVGSPFGAGGVTTGGMLSESVAPQVTEQLAGAPAINGGGSIGSSLLQAVRNNPMEAYSLLNSAGGLISDLTNGSVNGSGGNGGGGGLLGPLSIGGVNYTPNQNTVNQLNQLYGGDMSRPIGFENSFGSFNGLQSPQQTPSSGLLGQQTGTQQTGGALTTANPPRPAGPVWDGFGPSPPGTSPVNPTGSPNFQVGNLNINREAFRRMYGRDPSEVYGGQLNQQTGPGTFTDTGNGTFSYRGPVDQSFNNIAMGDQFTGVRPLVRDPARGPEMWQWVAGRPISVSNGNPALDQYEMTRQWGVGGTSMGNNPFVQNTNRWMG